MVLFLIVSQLIHGEGISCYDKHMILEQGGVYLNYRKQD